MSETTQWPLPVRTALLRLLKGIGKQLTWAVPVWVVVFGSYAAFWWYRHGSTTHSERLFAITIPLAVTFGVSVLVTAVRVSRLRKGVPPTHAQMARAGAPLQVAFCVTILIHGILVGSYISLTGASANVLVGKVGMQLIPAVFSIVLILCITGIRGMLSPDARASGDEEHGKQ